MNNNTIHSENQIMQHTQVTSMSNIRVLHTVPDILNIDIFINNQLIAANLAYGKNTEYISIAEGAYTVSLYMSGMKDLPIISSTLVINRDTTVTVVAAGYLNDIGLFAIYDANMRMEPNKAMIRFAHLSPNAPAVDITLPDGTILFDDVSFKQLKPYISISPENYTLHVRMAGTIQVLTIVTNVNLRANRYYTLYAIGSLGEEPEFEATLLSDGV